MSSSTKRRVSDESESNSTDKMYYLTILDSQSESKTKSLLSDLGKSTLRGVKKCPKCGTYNGTRGFSCKNKNCDVVFKEAGEKKKHAIEVCKLDTGTSTRIYSVKMKDRGPDHRGFVQLPVLEPDLMADSEEYLSQVSPLCFVDSCQRLFNANILKCHEKQIMPPVTSCSHIQSAMRCSVEATPLAIDYDILQSLNFFSSLKEEIWRMSNEMPCPLVQRVSQNVMAVRCKVTTKDPLGFIHVTFAVSPRFKENVCLCTCSVMQAAPKKLDKKVSLCLHYYTCIAAFASDPKCSEEFAQFISNESNTPLDLNPTPTEIEDLDVGPLVAILRDDAARDNVKAEEFHAEFMLTDEEFEGLSAVDDVPVDLNEALRDHQFDTIIIKPPAQTKKIKVKKKISPKRKIIKTKKLLPSKQTKLFSGEMREQLGVSKGNVNIDETRVGMTFTEWLASVTERINQSMHFGFNGKPEPLVFHAPHVFFECLLRRHLNYSNGVKKSKLPNLVTTFTRKDAPPVGTFTNFTWHISEVLHAKTVFDTPSIKLNLSRSFTMNSDGEYEEFDPETMPVDTHRKQGQALIKPAEYKTYLKIGHKTADQSSPCVLSMDWTPNVLPVSQIGELKISFEYGHGVVNRGGT